MAALSAKSCVPSWGPDTAAKSDGRRSRALWYPVRRRMTSSTAGHARRRLLGPILLTLIIAAAASLMVTPVGPAGESIREGDLAPRSLAATHQAQYESDVLTGVVRAAAAARVPDVYFSPDPLIGQQQQDKLRQFFDDFRALYLRGGLTLAQRVNEAQSIPGASLLSPSAQFNILNLDRAGFEDFRDRSLKALTDVLIRPVRQDQAQDRIGEYFDNLQTRPPDALQLAALREVLNAYVVANVKVDATATAEARKVVRAGVAPVISSYSAGQRIVQEGKRLDAADIEALRETGVLSSSFDVWRTLGGILAGLAVALALTWYLAAGDYPPIDQRPAWATAAFAVVVLGAARLALPEFLPDREQHYLPFALPLPAVALVAAVLRGRGAGSGVAATVGLFGAFIAATFSDLAGSGFAGSLAGFELASAFVAGGLAATSSARFAQRSWRVAGTAGAVALAVGGTLAVFWLIGEPRDNARLGWLALAALASGAASSVIGWGVVAAASSYFGLTSPAALARLSQTNHPLLRRLQAEAPGTYQHSLAVASLAEAAADRIAADPLLARVGALYHDVGKLGEPRLYIENMLDGAPSPHETLQPAASAAAIRAHVTRGIEIARDYGLPVTVRDFIPQHHGTRLVTFFYRRAVASGEPLDIADYRYAGPRPQSREAAIVMLADSSEAIVRADADHSPTRIAQLVDSIVAERIAEGELDECEISLRQLHAISASFKETLRAIYHPRVAYPVLAPEELARAAAD